MSKPYILYIPGLGDHSVRGQEIAVKLWRLWGVRTEVYRLLWDDAEPWEQKYNRLLEHIDELVTRGDTVGLVGSSAGAAAVIAAFAARRDAIAGCVLISGKVQHPQAIGASYRRETPAFVRAAYASAEALKGLGGADRQRILSRYGRNDPIVPARDSIIEGAHNHRLWTGGHAFTIGTQLIFGAPGFLRFLRRLAAK